MRADALYFVTTGPGSANGTWKEAIGQSPKPGTVVPWHFQATVRVSEANPHAPRRVPRLSDSPGSGRTRSWLGPSSLSDPRTREFERQMDRRAAPEPGRRDPRQVARHHHAHGEHEASEEARPATPTTTTTVNKRSRPASPRRCRRRPRPRPPRRPDFDDGRGLDHDHDDDRRAADDDDHDLQTGDDDDDEAQEEEAGQNRIGDATWTGTPGALRRLVSATRHARHDSATSRRARWWTASRRTARRPMVTASTTSIPIVRRVGPLAKPPPPVPVSTP